MKLILHTLLVSQILISTLIAGSSQGIIDDVVTGIKQICLPDGKSLYGDTNAVMGAHCFKSASHKNAAIIPTITKLATALKNPRKPNDAWLSFFSVDFFTPKEVIDLYQTLAQEAATLNPEALLVFQIMLRSGEISGFTLPGLQIQPERAKIYDVLYKWRKNFPLTDDEKALLDDLVFSNTSPIYADNVARTQPTNERTSTLRHRHVVHGSAPTDDRPEAEEKQPLLRPVKAH